MSTAMKIRSDVWVPSICPLDQRLYLSLIYYHKWTSSFQSLHQTRVWVVSQSMIEIGLEVVIEVRAGPGPSPGILGRVHLLAQACVAWPWLFPGAYPTSLSSWLISVLPSTSWTDFCSSFLPNLESDLMIILSLRGSISNTRTFCCLRHLRVWSNPY